MRSESDKYILSAHDLRVKEQVGMKFTRNMTEGNIYRAFLSYALPLLLSSILSRLYSTFDAVVAGKFISENALGAISTTGSYDVLLSSLFTGFASGFGIYIAQQFGKGEFSSVRRDVMTMGIFLEAVTVVIILFSALFCDPILDYLKVDAILRPHSKTYFLIYITGYVFSYLNAMLLHTLYALGCTSFSLFITLTAAVLNIGGNLISVLVFDLGVAGLAAVTVLSNMVTTVCYLFLLKKAFAEMGCKKTPYVFKFSCIRQSLRYAVPAAIQQVAFHGVGVLIAPSINGLGAAATTANNVSNQLYSIGTMSLWAVTSAFGNHTSQCVGKGEYQKIRKGLKAGFIMNVLLMLPFILVPMIFARPVISLFFPKGFVGDAYVFAVRYASFWLPFVYVQLIGHMFHSYMRGLGSIGTVLCITVVVGAARVISTVLLIPSMHIYGAYLGQVISWAVDALISAATVFCFYRTDDQLKRIVNRVRIK